MIHKKQFQKILITSVFGGIVAMVASVATASGLPPSTAFVTAAGLLGVTLAIANAISNALPNMPDMPRVGRVFFPNTTPHHHTYKKQPKPNVYYVDPHTHVAHKQPEPNVYYVHPHTHVAHKQPARTVVKQKTTKPVTFSSPKPTVGKTHSYLGKDKIVKKKPSQPTTKSHIGSDVIIKDRSAPSSTPVVTHVVTHVVKSQNNEQQAKPPAEKKKSGLSGNVVIRKR